MRKTGFTIALAGLALIAAVPATAQDRRVPADAGGKLAEFAGEPWYEPLSYCTAVWSHLADLTPEAAEQGAYRQNAVAFRHRGALRLGADRGWTHQRALEVFGRRVENHVFMMRRLEDRQQVLSHGPECQAVLETYDAANP